MYPSLLSLCHITISGCLHVWGFGKRAQVKVSTINNPIHSQMSSQGHRECSEPYDTVSASKEVFYSLLKDPTLPLPEAVRSLGANVKILGLGRHPTIPSPWKEAEAITALKALEAALAIALGRLRYPELGYQQAEIDSDHATAFLFMSYLSRIDGTGKWDSGSVKRLKRESFCP